VGPGSPKPLDAANVVIQRPHDYIVTRPRGGVSGKGAAGTFYEGVMTSGFPSASTESAVQANIVAAGYTT
jgi:hypothetical protein